MENSTLLLKLKQRLNKLDSQDYDNIECWQFVEAFNKAQIEWCRRNLHGGNMYKEGDELSKSSLVRTSGDNLYNDPKATRFSGHAATPKGTKKQLNKYFSDRNTFM